MWKLIRAATIAACAIFMLSASAYLFLVVVPTGFQPEQANRINNVSAALGVAGLNQ